MLVNVTYGQILNACNKCDDSTRTLYINIKHNASKEILYIYNQNFNIKTSIYIHNEYVKGLNLKWITLNMLGKKERRKERRREGRNMKPVTKHELLYQDRGCSRFISKFSLGKKLNEQTICSGDLFSEAWYFAYQSNYRYLAMLVSGVSDSTASLLRASLFHTNKLQLVIQKFNSGFWLLTSEILQCERKRNISKSSM